MSRVIAIVGPTDTGKSRLAIEIALEFNGEIVSADSRQIYRGMDIGTAKPSLEELSEVPHYLINIANPNEEFSMAHFQGLALTCIKAIQKCDKLPVMAGGTGQYVWSVLEGWKVPEVAPDIEYRRTLEERASRGEADELYNELIRVNPKAAARIDPRNTRRMIRALEVSKSGAAGNIEKQPPPFDSLIIGLTCARKELYRRTDRRVDEMINKGLVDEVKRLLEIGYSRDLPAMSGIGYRQIIEYLGGKISLTEAVSRIKFETHRYIRQQYNWFRPGDNRIHWFDIATNYRPEISVLISGFLANHE